MLPRILPAIALLAIAVAPAAAAAKAAVELNSVSLELPFGDRTFPPGPGSDAITRNCLACHSAGMVLNQPALSRQAWAAEVNKMIHSYDAPVVPGDVDAIVGYLAATKGTK
jgi:cytochrome c5